MDYTYTESIQKLEDLKKKYPVLVAIADIHASINNVSTIFGSNKNDFKELEIKLENFQNTLNANCGTFTIYTNHTGIGKHIVKEGLPKEEAQAICATCNAGIKVPLHKNIKEMIGYMWILEEQS